MLGEMFASYVESLRRCANSYQTVSIEDTLEDLPIAMGARVRILKGDYPTELRHYQGCAATIVGYDHGATERPYRLREEITGREICWYRAADLMPCSDK